MALNPLHSEWYAPLFGLFAFVVCAFLFRAFRTLTRINND